MVDVFNFRLNELHSLIYGLNLTLENLRILLNHSYSLELRFSEPIDSGLFLVLVLD